MLKSILFASITGLLISAAPVTKTKELSQPLAGDYVEARTASVFCGACHYNGEYMYTGNDAVAAWRFTSGSWHGVDLAGVSMIADVASGSNLAENASRRTELTIDSAANPAQRAAALSLVREKYAASFGDIAAVHYEPVVFKHDSSQYTVSAPGFASLNVQAMPDGSCCTQPYQVWYSPLVELKGREVGYTVRAEYDGAKISDEWQRFAENSSFYGPIAF